MANDEHVAILKKGVAAWNKWRDENGHIRPVLNKADFLGRVDLRGADLRWADLGEAFLNRADLNRADLGEALRCCGCRYNTGIPHAQHEQPKEGAQWRY
jgi:uncharacterized protein YjbI with pentapeptide repeats